MEIKGKISILIGRDRTTIEVFDEDACVQILDITLTPEQLSAALSSQSRTDCESTIVINTDKIGKVHENKTFEFEIPDGYRTKEQLKEIAQSKLTDGWIAEGYFGSQNSFFEKGGKRYARTTIRRWHDKFEF